MSAQRVRAIDPKREATVSGLHPHTFVIEQCDERDRRVASVRDEVHDRLIRFFLRRVENVVTSKRGYAVGVVGKDRRQLHAFSFDTFLMEQILTVLF